MNFEYRGWNACILRTETARGARTYTVELTAPSGTHHFIAKTYWTTEDAFKAASAYIKARTGTETPARAKIINITEGRKR
jgi:hypothetical protein